MSDTEVMGQLREASALLRRAEALLGEAQRSMSDPTGLLMMARGSAQNAATWTDDVLAQDVTR